MRFRTWASGFKGLRGRGLGFKMLTCNLRVTARVSLCGGSGFGDQSLRFRTWASGFKGVGARGLGFKMLTCNLRVTARV